MSGCCMAETEQYDLGTAVFASALGRGKWRMDNAENFCTLEMAQDNTRISDSIKIPDAFVKLLILSHAHLGGTSANKNFARYLYGTRPQDKINIIDIDAMWEKLVIAARAFCGIKHPSTIAVVSTKAFGRKPVAKFCEAVGATPITGRFIPGSFTNSQVRRMYDPRVLIVSDTHADKQAVLESQYCNLPTIAFVNADNPMGGVDIGIPMNNRSPAAIAAGFFILSRLINYMKTGAELDRDMKEVELFLFRDSVELEQLAEEQKLLETADSILNVGKEEVLSGASAGNPSEWSEF